MEKEVLLEARNVSKEFSVGQKKILKAVDDVSIEIYKGETLGLVGESGCGKTTFGRTMIRLHEPTSGRILFKGKEIQNLKGKELLAFKKQAQIIFQDPYASLDPRMTIADIVMEGIQVHFPDMEMQKKYEKVKELLYKVGLSEDYGNRYAHELSGGQRQRVGIARALAVEPEFIVCDEPISALDVSIQAQVVNLLIAMQREYQLTYLFISHDLSMVRHISDRIGVMYLGSLVELSECSELYKNPLHPYTQALLSAIPLADPDLEESKKRIKLQGEIPSPIDLKPGCKFKQRCKYATELCDKVRPTLREVEKGHFAACHLLGDEEEKGSEVQSISV